MCSSGSSQLLLIIEKMIWTPTLITYLPISHNLEVREAVLGLRKRRSRVTFKCVLVRVFASSCSTSLWEFSQRLQINAWAPFKKCIFIFFISCHRHYGWPHVAMATEPHPAGNPRAHHPDTTSQAHASLRLLRHGYVREVRPLTHLCVILLNLWLLNWVISLLMNPSILRQNCRVIMICYAHLDIITEIKKN